ncbi:uncharacterized protein ACA1_122080 [Acanthamoeba castellanii str. Neff]|uniref:Clu domain-containing protein n=1 Tax=Acanthamoeba castellanii (strain ATCC 30010 / Neff) TaxID=1257118 RepID=L8GEL6_ACACF|nr:uncharacterized protein ACA1_122080 [Acanthamoeba castellanii str. Neff]ELR11467.1 hypothetical protein ACA1_122080 [Acanthamoeba castellanii str. Neff]
MAEPTPNKFSQLKQFWQKGKKEEGEATTTAAATTAAHRQVPPQATQAPAPTATTTTATAPAFDPYGATDDLSFVPEDEDEGVNVKKVESQSADSLYTMDEQFVEEKDEEETKVEEEKKDEGVAQAQASSPESLYAASETFVDEEVEEEVKAVAAPKGAEEDEAGENRYAYTAAASDVAYAMDDEFNPEGDAAASASAPAPSYGADSSAFQDIYGMADEQLNKEDDSIYARKEYSATPYEVFQADSPSAAYYSGAIDEVLAEDNETNKSLYGEDDEEIRVPSAYGTEDVEGVADDGDNKKEEAESDSDDDFTDSEDEDDVKKPRRDQTKNWNTDFQHLLDMPPSAEKFTKLARLAHDFVFAAETYGKIIISELGLPVEKKTIKPVAAGGQAGGEKYIVQGIFFKFALDIFGIYGGDEYAMKAASHDLKGLIHYYSCQIPGLHVPLMALIDYLGFRLIAITILPINNTTIQYGSCDAGQTVYADDPRLNEMMEQAGRKMKLQGHYVGVPGGMRRKLYAPVDIEGHKGLDGRYYVVDFARTFPPERPSPAKYNAIP